MQQVRESVCSVTLRRRPATIGGRSLGSIRSTNCCHNRLGDRGDVDTRYVLILKACVFLTA